MGVEFMIHRRPTFCPNTNTAPLPFKAEARRRNSSQRVVGLFGPMIGACPAIGPPGYRQSKPACGATVATAFRATEALWLVLLVLVCPP